VEPLESGIDLFYDRLMVVEKTMHAKLAKTMAHSRTLFLKKFIEQFKKELIESSVV